MKKIKNSADGFWDENIIFCHRYIKKLTKMKKKIKKKNIVK